MNTHQGRWCANPSWTLGRRPPGAHLRRTTGQRNACLRRKKRGQASKQEGAWRADYWISGSADQCFTRGHITDNEQRNPRPSVSPTDATGLDSVQPPPPLSLSPHRGSSFPARQWIDSFGKGSASDDEEGNEGEEGEQVTKETWKIRIPRERK
ncbi:hypothetical protein LX36DRAFT_340791 [Colletotrichum falcatum]|nr:hypothetical protein LX36DRAFT_340791 [Colletotrichum falcatum]